METSPPKFEIRRAQEHTYFTTYLTRQRQITHYFRRRQPILEAIKNPADPSICIEDLLERNYDQKITNPREEYFKILLNFNQLRKDMIEDELSKLTFNIPHRSPSKAEVQAKFDKYYNRKLQPLRQKIEQRVNERKNGQLSLGKRAKSQRKMFDEEKNVPEMSPVMKRDDAEVSFFLTLPAEETTKGDDGRSFSDLFGPPVPDVVKVMSGRRRKLPPLDLSGIKAQPSDDFDQQPTHNTTLPVHCVTSPGRDDPPLEELLASSRFLSKASLGKFLGNHKRNKSSIDRLQELGRMCEHANLETKSFVTELKKQIHERQESLLQLNNKLVTPAQKSSENWNQILTEKLPVVRTKSRKYALREGLSAENEEEEKEMLIRQKRLDRMLQNYNKEKQSKKEKLKQRIETEEKIKILHRYLKGKPPI